MPGRGWIHKELWGRSLFGLLAAVAMMSLAAYSAARWFESGVVANKHVNKTDWVLAWLEYQQWLWGSIFLTSFILALFLLGMGIRPTLGTSDSRRKWKTLPLEDRFDRVLHRYGLFKERHEKWFLPIQHYLGRLFWAGIGTVVILFLYSLRAW